MPSPPRILIPGHAVLVSTRVEEGLPFVPTELMNFILWSALARAQSLYPVEICSFLFMQNHAHFIILVKEPEDVVNFMDRIKTETSHAINRLLGRRKRTLWCDGYDAVPILTYEDLIEKFAYIYANPQKPGLVDTIDEYPGISSWSMFSEDISRKDVPWVRRPMVEPLDSLIIQPSEDRRLVKDLRRKCKVTHSFVLSPFSWISYYGKTIKDISEIKTQIVRRVRELEGEFRLVRTKSCLGAQALRTQSMDLSYTPKKYSKRMWCICQDVAIRVAFIEMIKDLRVRAKNTYRRWKTGDLGAKFPLGLFPPRVPRLGNLVPQSVFSYC